MTAHRHDRAAPSRQERSPDGRVAGMACVSAQVVQVASDPFPGWVRLEVRLASGLPAALHDKQPVLGLDQPQIGATVRLACEVVGPTPDGAVNIQLLHGVETSEGHAQLTVDRQSVTF